MFDKLSVRRQLAGTVLACTNLIAIVGTAHPAAAQQHPADRPTANGPTAGRQASDDDSGPTPGTSAMQLSRADAIGRSLRQNYGIDISRTRRDIARRNVSYGNAGFLPTLSARASQTHVFGGTGLFGGDQIRTQTQLGLQLDWLVFGGLGRFAAYQRLESQRRMQSLQTQRQVESTLVEVSTAYWNVVRQRRIRAALKDTRDISRQRVEIARARLAAGSGNEVEVNLARVQLNGNLSDLAEQKIALEQARTNLNQTLARPADRPVRVAAHIDALQPLDYQTLRADALAYNRRIQVARAQKDVASERIQESRATLWPSLSVSLAYNYSEYHADVAPSFNAEPGLEYGIVLNVPLFEGFNRLREIDNAQSRKLIASTTIDQQTSVVVAELRTRWETYRRQAERTDLAGDSVALAQDNTDVALASLKAGTISQFDLRQVQLNLLDAQIRLINAQVAAKQAEIRLLELAGRLYKTWVHNN